MRECIYKGVYVDVDSGETRGEYTINPLIMTPSGSGSIILDKYYKEPNIKETRTKKVQDIQIQPQKKEKVGFFGKIINWFKSLFS